MKTFLSLQLAEMEMSSIDLKVELKTPVTIELTFIARFTHCPRVIIPNYNVTSAFLILKSYLDKM